MPRRALLWARRGAGPRGLARLARRARRLPGDSRGMVAVEFALVLVVFLPILFGIMAFGFQFAARIALSYAVAEAGRSAAVGLSSPERQARAADAMDRVLTSFAPLLDPGRADVTVSSGGQTVEGEVIEIAVTYEDDRFNVFPFLPALNANRAVRTSFLVADPSG